VSGRIPNHNAVSFGSDLQADSESDFGASLSGFSFRLHSLFAYVVFLLELFDFVQNWLQAHRLVARFVRLRL